MLTKASIHVYTIGCGGKSIVCDFIIPSVKNTMRLYKRSINADGKQTKELVATVNNEDVIGIYAYNK